MNIKNTLLDLNVKTSTEIIMNTKFFNEDKVALYLLVENNFCSQSEIRGRVQYLNDMYLKVEKRGYPTPHISIRKNISECGTVKELRLQ